MLNRLKVLRSEYGMTQEEVADRVGVSRQTIISIESGRYNPSIILAYKLSCLFSISIEDMFCISEHIESEDNDE